MILPAVLQIERLAIYGNFLAGGGFHDPEQGRYPYHRLAQNPRIKSPLAYSIYPS
jgi:hypothetical protein